MKSQVFILFLIVLFMGSCGSESGKRAAKEREEIAKLKDPKTAPIKAKADTITATPFLVGVSEIEADFTPYPDFDGGEGYSIKFDIGVKLKGEEKSRSIGVEVTGYSDEAGGAKKSLPILNGKKIYQSLKTVKAEDVLVTIVNGQIIKIATKEDWNGSVFTPEKIIWARSMQLDTIRLL